MKELSRKEMKNIKAGKQEPHDCLVATRNPDGSWAGWVESPNGCFTPDQAQFYYSGGTGWVFPDGTHASGYCCVSCGTDGFSSAPKTSEIC